MNNCSARAWQWAERRFSWRLHKVTVHPGWLRSLLTGRRSGFGKWCVAREGVTQGEICNAVAQDHTASVSARIPWSVSGEALRLQDTSSCPVPGHSPASLGPPPHAGDKVVYTDQSRWLSLSVAAAISSSVPKMIYHVFSFTSLFQDQLGKKTKPFLADLIKVGSK